MEGFHEFREKMLGFNEDRLVMKIERNPAVSCGIRVVALGACSDVKLNQCSSDRHGMIMQPSCYVAV